MEMRLSAAEHSTWGRGRERRHPPPHVHWPPHAHDVVEFHGQYMGMAHVQLDRPGFVSR
jgi:hypothetical protein